VGDILQRLVAGHSREAGRGAHDALAQADRQIDGPKLTA
jgi:hypothetical protein